MRPSLVVALVLSACDRGSTETQLPQAAAQTAALAEGKVEVEGVRAFLAAAGVQVKNVDEIGPMSELSCAAPRHYRLTLADSTQVEISRFANDRAALECLTVIQRQSDAGWTAVKSNYLVHGHWLVVSAAELPAAERDKLQHAFDQAL